VTVFADTAALYALLDSGEREHTDVARVWREFLDSNTTLITTNYILIEAAAVIQRRLGLAALRAFHDEIAPALAVVWIDADLHRSGVEATLIAARRNLSVVDCISFRVMRLREIDVAFTLDAHFREQGFTVIPGP
jgi:uncharacterized protein